MRSINAGGNTVVRFSVWDDWELLEEYDTSNVKQAAYLQGGSGVIKSLVNNIYYYQDKLGSTTHIADGGGNLLESYRYDLYGTPSYFDSASQPLNASTVGVTDLYAGERWIGELRLYDLRNRFMSPELGRFLQTDPIGFQGDASNLYRYCHNDPEDFSDPTGLIADWTWSHLMWEQGNSPYGFNDLYQSYVNAGASDGGGGGGNSGGGKSKSSSENGGKKKEDNWEKSSDEEAVKILSKETHRPDVSQTAVLTEGPPHHLGPVDEKRVLVDPANIGRGWKDQSLETLRWKGTEHQKIKTVHYHRLGGKLYGEPTQDHDLKMIKQGPLYFTNKDWAATGKFLILRQGLPPETRFDRRIIP
jgi:RHS repeat-associated protein